jgi:hypothetical protein
MMGTLEQIRERHGLEPLQTLMDPRQAKLEWWVEEILEELIAMSWPVLE